MTLEEIELLETEVLTCKQVAPILEMNQAELHETAIRHPEWLVFPVIRKTERGILFPKRAFIAFMKGENKNGESNSIRNS